MGRLHDERRPGDAGVIAGGGIIRPGTAAVFVLPFAHGHVLQIGSQRDLRRRNCACGVILEHLLTTDPGGLGVLARGQQREGNIRCGVDRQPGVRISIGNVGDIGQLPAGDGGQLILRDRQDIAAGCFTRGERRFRSAAFLAFPGDGQRGVVQGNRRLIGIHHRRDDQLSCRGRPVGAVGIAVHIMNLCARLIGPQINGKGLAVRQVNDGFGACGDDGHVNSSSKKV